jgi:LmbE family N-acetylglucosaminyl deacetylase
VSTPRLLCIGAHPDDCEFQASGLAALVSDAGGDVEFVSVTDGSAGHRTLRGEELIALRREEAQRGAAVIGARAVNLGFPDGWLQPTPETRAAVLDRIRRFQPDVVVCPRPFDYHPDHRAVGVAVQDASYLVMVPSILPDVDVPRVRPVLLHMSDPFTTPAPFSPDVVVDITGVVERKVDAIMEHRTQVYEWLPDINGFTHEVPAAEPDRTRFLRERERAKCRTEAERVREHLRAGDGPGLGADAEFAEAFEISEYGAPATSSSVRRLLGL